MSAVPAWIAATTGQPGQAGHVNQLLGRHNTVLLYGGATQAGLTTGTAAYTSTANTWIAQQVTPTASAIGGLLLQINAVGGSPITPLTDPLAVALYEDSNGAPTGSPLAAAVVSSEQIYTAPYWVPVPLVVSGLTPGTAYQLVSSPAGDTAHYYAWQQATGTGASTSPDGETWTPTNTGLMHQVLDQSVTGPLTGVVEDGGTRVTQLGYDSSARLSTITETVVDQVGAAFTSTRTLAYSGGLLIGVS
jgi:hypothetical protein